MKIRLVRYTEDPVMAMAQAAAVCYNSEPSPEVVKKCLEAGHLSIAEFADFHFYIEGISRVASHQLVRKRMASYAQRSQRYVSEEGCSLYAPNSISASTQAMTIYEAALKVMYQAYKDLLRLGIPKEDARYILPEAVHTNIHMKLNFRSLMEFCNQRMCSRAQAEIRDLAYGMKDLVENVSPFLAAYLRPKCETLKYCPEGEKSCGRYSKNAQRDEMKTV